jgi:hypothetical protein
MTAMIIRKPPARGSIWKLPGGIVAGLARVLILASLKQQCVTMSVAAL